MQKIEDLYVEGCIFSENISFTYGGSIFGKLITNNITILNSTF